jgi:hypothetical protein
VNDVYLLVSNQGQIGLNIETGRGSGYFPDSTNNQYVFGLGLWFGAIYDADNDSVPDKVFTQSYDPRNGGTEFREGRRDQDPNDPLTRVFDSTEPQDLAEWPPQFSDQSGEPIVYSDQDLVTTYTTEGKEPVFGPFQLPLEINQRSMAVVSPDSVDQVIYFIFEVTHVGDKVLEDAWVGFFGDMDVGFEAMDDLVSVIFNRVTPQGDTVRLDVGYAWDSNFSEGSFVGDPGFVGVSFLFGPGNPDDGIDNDGDSIVDESPFNGIDDDYDGFTDEWDEVDEIGLVNFSRVCNYNSSCSLFDPGEDPIGYDILSCDSPGSEISCYEDVPPADIRLMLSSGPFDWFPGQTQTLAFAMVFANSIGSPLELDFIGDPPRPDPNDPILREFVRVTELSREFFPSLFPPLRIGDDPGGSLSSNLPKTFMLYQNYPNPFNPSTTISYELRVDHPCMITLRIYDLRGHLIRTLKKGHQSFGRYEVIWDGRDESGRSVGSGFYIYQLQTGNRISSRKMFLLK